MRRARNIFRLVLLVALASLVAVASASAHTTGAANRVSFGVQQSQLGYVGKTAYGDADFALTNPTTSPVYDLTVWITNGCSSSVMPTAPLSLLAKPPHMNPAVESLTGNPWSLRWHVAGLKAGQTLSLPLRFNVPFVAFPGPSAYDPATGTVASTGSGYYAPFLCLTASVTSEADNSYGPLTTPVWSDGGTK